MLGPGAIWYRHCFVADQFPVPPFWRHCPVVAVYVPDAEENAAFAAPVKVSVLCDCVSWRDKASPIAVPDITAVVPQEVPAPIKVT